MRTMILATMIAMLAAVFVPAASADLNQCDPTFTVCAGDNSYSWGGCNSGFEYGYDYVNANTPAGSVYAEGFGFCGYGFTENALVVWGYTPAGYFFVEYFDYSYGSYSYCNTSAYSQPTGYQSLGCPAGPLPNPGWGSLTP